jgi:hypothetical protein
MRAGYGAEMRTVLPQRRLLSWGIVTTPKLDSLDPDGGSFGDRDGGTLSNVTPLANLDASFVAERDSLFPRPKRLEMALAVGLIIGNPSLSGFAVRLSPSPLTNAHLIAPLSCDMAATWGKYTAETKGFQGAS